MRSECWPGEAMEVVAHEYEQVGQFRIAWHHAQGGRTDMSTQSCLIRSILLTAQIQVLLSAHRLVGYEVSTSQVLVGLEDSFESPRNSHCLSGLGRALKS